ncbi:efflux RND transporter permease subunit [Halobacteriovorax sp. CON-3]|uniref:efflux RND transporter permease subunit n=1 Tax=Halobacteriovorax sp. CON-3 TaxID=3157710 RepID=UPI00371811D2
MNHNDDKKHIFFVRRPIFAFVISLFTLILGGISILDLATEQYPNITPPVVSVTTAYTGANAMNMESSVASPLEQEINGVDNMLYMKSTNANDGTINISTSFEVGSDPDMNTVFTQNRVASATAKLPEEVKRLGVNTRKSLPTMLMFITLTSENNRYSREFLSNYGILNIKDVLARLKGIGRVDMLGSSDYSMRFWIRPELLAKYGLTVPEILNAVREQNVIVPGGKFGAEPAPKGTDFTYSVKMQDRLQTPEEFGEIVVRTNENGSQVFLSDVARIELGVENYEAFARVNADPSALVAIYQAPGANGVELANDVKKTIHELSKKFPPGMSYQVSYDSTLPITAGIKEIVITLVVALLLVIFVVFIFIQDWRASLIPTIAIPISLIGAFIFFPFLGFSINTLSLLGLVLAIGIVVDDAIVVVEAVQVNIENGMDVKTATTEAIRKVTGAVMATTLVLVAVFVPVAGMAGITGLLYQQFAITIAVSVCISSVNALTLSPALCVLLLKEKKEYSGILGGFFHLFNKAFDRSSKSYMNLTEVFARRTKRGFLFILILTGCIAVIGKYLPAGFIAVEDMGYYFINVQLPEASSLQRTDAVVSKVEDTLMKFEEIQFVTSVVGFSILSGAKSTNSAFVIAQLKDWSERSVDLNMAVRKANGVFFTKFPQAQIFALSPPAIPGLGNGSGFTFMLQDRLGTSVEKLYSNAQKLIAAANKRPELSQVFTTFKASVPQKLIEINREKALKMGIRLNDIYVTLSAFLGGSYVNDFNRFGKLYKAYIQAEPQYRLDGSKLSTFYVVNRSGDKIPLSSIVTVKESSGPDYITRYNLYRSIEITGSPAAGYSSAQALKVMEEVARQTLDEGMGYEWSNMSFQEKRSQGSGAIVFVFALIFVYLILSAQYESWSLPLSILLGTPFAIFGAMLFVYLARLFSNTYENNVFMQVSLVMLIAMAAKNAILIVEFANINFREEGMSLFDSAMDSAKQRLRPILMTAVSFILGVLPLVFATGTGSESRKVMGMSLLGGMTIATVIGIFLYPMLFVFIGKLFGYEKKEKDSE